MKLLSLLLVVVICLGLVRIGHAEDMVQGFSGIVWGTSIEDVKNLEESARSGDIHYYKRVEDFYSMAGVNFSDIIYGFYQGQYFAAYMKVTSSDDRKKIKKHLDTLYGDARAQFRTDRTIYIWDYQDVKIKLKEYQAKSHAKLSFYYRPLSKKVNEAKAKATKGAEKSYKLELAEPEYDF